MCGNVMNKQHKQYSNSLTNVDLISKFFQSIIEEYGIHLDQSNPIVLGLFEY